MKIACAAVLLAFMALGPAAARDLNCGAPSASQADLINHLRQYERGVRDLRLAPDVRERLLEQGRQQIIANYSTMRDIEVECARRAAAAAANRPEDSARLRSIERQNRAILQGQDDISRQNRDLQDTIDRGRRGLLPY